MSDELLALSPLDGRYIIETESLREYFSEFALIRDRVRNRDRLFDRTFTRRPSYP